MKHKELVESDYVLTPEWCAKDIMEYFAPTGKILDPCRGLNKVFHNQMPNDADWCEIQEGNNFFESELPLLVCFYSIQSPYLHHKNVYVLSIRFVHTSCTTQVH